MGWHILTDILQNCCNLINRSAFFFFFLGGGGALSLEQNYKTLILSLPEDRLITVLFLDSFNKMLSQVDLPAYVRSNISQIFYLGNTDATM